MTAIDDKVWKSAEVAQEFLEGMRAAIPLAAEQLDVMLRIIHSAQPQLMRFMDVGCGDGVLGRAILSAFPQAQGVFLDFSEPMIDAARSKVTADQHRVTLVVEDYGQAGWVKAVQDLAPFDTIVSGYSIHHQPDLRKHAIYQEIYDLLKPGGVFLNIEHVAPSSEWAEALFNELFIDTIYAVSQTQGIAKSRDTVADEFHNRAHKDANILAPVEVQCGWLRDIGFIEVECYLRVFELAVFGGIRQ